MSGIRSHSVSKQLRWQDGTVQRCALWIDIEALQREIQRHNIKKDRRKNKSSESSNLDAKHLFDINALV